MGCEWIVLLLAAAQLAATKHQNNVTVTSSRELKNLRINMNSFSFLPEEWLNSPAAWRINLACMPFVLNFSNAATNFTYCALNASLPPLVCTECVDQFMDMELQYELAHQANNVSSLLNSSCSEVMFQDYLVSFVKEVFDSLKTKVWDKSKCEKCLSTDFRSKTLEYTNNTLTFMAYLTEWRECIENVTVAVPKMDVCDVCMKSYEALFSFYWSIYINPNEDLCLDVESTMNDTANVWRIIFKCHDPRPNRDSESLMVMLLSVFFLIITVLFYAGSFIQGERKKRDLIKYSRFRTPQGPRSRLLSASLMADDDDEQFSEAPSSSQTSSNMNVHNRLAPGGL